MKEFSRQEGSMPLFKNIHFINKATLIINPIHAFGILNELTGMAYRNRSIGSIPQHSDTEKGQAVFMCINSIYL